MNFQDVLMVSPTSPLMCNFYLTSLVPNLDLVTSLEPRATEDIKVSIKLISVDLPKGNRQNYGEGLHCSGQEQVLLFPLRFNE